MPKVFTSEKQKIGEFGESIAVKYLIKQGFSILDRNYTKKWGEIDIVAEKNKILYFIEVKSVALAEAKALASRRENVSHETNDDYRAEDNMHPWKLKRLSRTIQTYLIHKRIGNTPWQFDLLLVYIDLKERKARVRVMENIIL